MLGESASISFESFKQCRVLITACGWGVESDLQLQLSLAEQAIIHEVVSLWFVCCNISNDANSRFDLITVYTLRWEILCDSPVMTREMGPLCGSGGPSRDKRLKGRQGGGVCVCVYVTDLSV